MSEAHQPARVLGRPTTAEELAALLRQASAEQIAIVPWGVGRRQHLGYPPPPHAQRIELGSLDQLVDYVPEDLTVTVQAGVSFGTIQELLAARGQWLPWDPPGGPEASLGGLLASGAIGALRLAYGTPRDWVLGMQVALADGRLARSGSRVVKNVAGYDLHKLHLGALGTLGVIVEATLKTLPVPERQATLLAGFAQLAQALHAAEALRSQPLAPAALALLSRRGIEEALADRQHGLDGAEDFVLLGRFAGTAAAVARQVDIAIGRAAAQGGRCLALTESDSALVWRRLPALLDHKPTAGALLRVGVPPAALAQAIGLVGGEQPELPLLALPGVGTIWARWPADPPASEARLQELRQGLAVCKGYAVVEDCPLEAGSTLDRWGSAPPTLPLMQAIKRRWDPAGILNPGRFIVG